MARLIYACLALAAASLVAGFLIRTTSIPLLISIGLSGVIAVLILAGWSKRLRASGAFDGGADAEAALEMVDIESELEGAEPSEEIEPADAAVTQVRRRPSRRAARRPATEPPRAPTRAGSGGRRSRVRADQTTEIPQTPTPTSRPRRKPVKATPKRPARSKATRKQPQVRAAPATTPMKKAKPPARSKPKAAAARKKAPSQRASASQAETGPTAKRAGRVLVLPGRSRFHAAGCRFARGDDVREVSEAAARRRGYEPCNVCMAGTS